MNEQVVKFIAFGLIKFAFEKIEERNRNSRISTNDFAATKSKEEELKLAKMAYINCKDNTI